MKKLIISMYNNTMIRYLFFGGCTTLVNLVSFYCLRQMNVAMNLANAISIVVAILFAYIVNSKFVFHDKCESLRDHIKPFGKFIGARACTMFIEIGGLWFLVEVLLWKEMIGKLLIQFVIIVLNYVFSKFFVFTSGKKQEEAA